MKKLITWILVMVALVLLLCGAGAMSLDQQAKIDALIAEWEVEYSGEFGWEVLMDDMPPLQPDEISKEEALALAIETVCEMRDINDIGYFRGLRSFFGFNSDRVWVVSLLPLDHLTEWGYWVFIDAKTGELFDYKQAEPKPSEEWRLSDEPKG